MAKAELIVCPDCKGKFIEGHNYSLCKTCQGIGKIAVPKKRKAENG